MCVHVYIYMYIYTHILECIRIFWKPKITWAECQDGVEILKEISHCDRSGAPSTSRLCPLQPRTRLAMRKPSGCPSRVREETVNPRAQRASLRTRSLREPTGHNQKKNKLTGRMTEKTHKREIEYPESFVQRMKWKKQLIPGKKKWEFFCIFSVGIRI